MRLKFSNISPKNANPPYFTAKLMFLHIYPDSIYIEKQHTLCVKHTPIDCTTVEFLKLVLSSMYILNCASIGTSAI